MKIRSAVPENGCLIFLRMKKKQKKQKNSCKTYTLPPHRRLRNESAWQFLSENATGDEHKKLKNSWKSLTKFF